MTIPSQDLKTCPRCKKETFELSKPRNLCRECDRAYYASYRERNRQKVNQRAREYRARKGDEYRKKSLQRFWDRVNAMNEEEKAFFYRQQADRKKNELLKIKEKVFEIYGEKCACCGELEKSFLTIDHINNDGATHRKEIGNGGDRILRWLRKNNYPEGFQILCWNCQWGKVKNNGVCPHQVRCDGQAKAVGSSESKKSAPYMGGDMTCSSWRHEADLSERIDGLRIAN
jgi:hypothetical protein